jgi:hypothetical protein
MLNKEQFKSDWHYTKKEIEEMRKEATQLTKDQLEELKDFVNKDVRLANEIYLTREFEKNLIEVTTQQLKSKKQNVFNQLRKYNLVDES